MARNNGSKTATGRFAPGNPGRPRGARHRVTRAVEALLEGEAEALTRKAIEAALGGDTTALRLCLERIAPAPRDRTVELDWPKVEAASDVPAALAAIIAAVAEGAITPGEGAALAALLERFRGAYELADIESRLRALEDTHANQD